MSLDKSVSGGSLSLGTTVSGDECIMGHLSPGTTVSGTSVSGDGSSIIRFTLTV